MLKGKILVVVFLLSMAIFAGSAFALSPGTGGDFIDKVIPGKANPWTHFLDDTDFTDALEGNEPFLIIEDAMLKLKLNFKPKLIGSQYAFFAAVTLDGYLLSNNLISYFAGSNTVVKNWVWSTSITNPNALNAIADKQAEIQITSLYGKLRKVKYSSLSGGYTVGPEPISMVLVGVGMSGLPIAKRIRRFMRKEN